MASPPWPPDRASRFTAAGDALKRVAGAVRRQATFDALPGLDPADSDGADGPGAGGGGGGGGESREWWAAAAGKRSSKKALLLGVQVRAWLCPSSRPAVQVSGLRVRRVS